MIAMPETTAVKRNFRLRGLCHHLRSSLVIVSICCIHQSGGAPPPPSGLHFDRPGSRAVRQMGQNRCDVLAYQSRKQLRTERAQDVCCVVSEVALHQ